MANFQLIKTIAREKGVTLAEVSTQVGITQQGLSKIIRDNISRTDTIEKIANVLGVSVSVFFEDNAKQSSNAIGAGALSIAGDNNITVPEKLLNMIVEKDKQIALKDARIDMLMDKLLAQKDGVCQNRVDNIK